MSKPRLILDPANPFDFEPGELEQFAAEAEAEAPAFSVIPVRRPEEGAGGPLTEVLHVWQDYSEVLEHGEANLIVAVYLIKKLKERWTRERDKHPPPAKPRMRVLNEYDEKEELVRSVVIDLPDGEAKESEVPAGQHAPHPRPRVDNEGSDRQ
jgi:hypothetical protein